MAFDDCRAAPIPGCPNYRGTEKYQYAAVPGGTAKKKTGEVCGAADIAKTITTRVTYDRRHGEEWEVPVTPYTVTGRIAECVDVYDGDIIEADARLKKELTETAGGRGGYSITAYKSPDKCPGELGRLLLAIFDPKAFEHSERYCNPGSVSAFTFINMVEETRRTFREQCLEGSFTACFGLASLSNRL